MALLVLFGMAGLFGLGVIVYALIDNKKAASSSAAN
jgi:hypothetical protein